MASLMYPRVDLTISRLADVRKTRWVVKISLCISEEMVSADEDKYETKISRDLFTFELENQA